MQFRKIAAAVAIAAITVTGTGLGATHAAIHATSTQSAAAKGFVDKVGTNILDCVYAFQPVAKDLGNGPSSKLHKEALAVVATCSKAVANVNAVHLPATVGGFPKLAQFKGLVLTAITGERDAGVDIAKLKPGTPDQKLLKDIVAKSKVSSKAFYAAEALLGQIEHEMGFKAA